MSKQIDLAKKIKALAERGIGGEKINAEKMLQEFLQKHNLKLSDIESDSMQDYFFTIDSNHTALFHQICGYIRYDMERWGPFNNKTITEGNLKGNNLVKCTLSEHIEINCMFDLFSKLYDQEQRIFFRAFITANKLFVNPPGRSKRSYEDLSPAEQAEIDRAQKLAKNVNNATYRKQIGGG